MNLSKILKNTILVIIFGLVVTACATKKTVKTTGDSSTSTTQAAQEKSEPVKSLGSLMQGDVYIGSDSVGELASGVPDLSLIHI